MPICRKQNADPEAPGAICRNAAESLGWWALLIAAAIFFPIGFWIERRDNKRKRHEAEQAALRAEAARLHDDIADGLSRPR